VGTGVKRGEEEGSKETDFTQRTQRFHREHREGRRRRKPNAETPREQRRGHDLLCPYKDEDNPRGRGKPLPYKGKKAA
jgi:hypothetical protein